MSFRHRDALIRGSLRVVFVVLAWFGGWGVAHAAWTANDCSTGPQYRVGYSKYWGGGAVYSTVLGACVADATNGGLLATVVGNSMCVEYWPDDPGGEMIVPVHDVCLPVWQAATVAAGSGGFALPAPSAEHVEAALAIAGALMACGVLIVGVRKIIEMFGRTPDA